MKITVQADRENDQLYVALSDHAFDHGCVARSIRATDDIALDFDANDKLVGVDVMNAAEHLVVVSGWAATRKPARPERRKARR